MSLKENTRWVRSARTTTAHRTDNLTVTLTDQHWVVLKGGQTTPLSVLPLGTFIDKAIEAADEAFPPAPWKFAAGVWTAGTCSVRTVENGWCVERTVSEIGRAHV